MGRYFGDAAKGPRLLAPLCARPEACVAADAGDRCTVRETVCEAGEQIATVAGWEQSQGINPAGQRRVLDRGTPATPCWWN